MYGTNKKKHKHKESVNILTLKNALRVSYLWEEFSFLEVSFAKFSYFSFSFPLK